VVLLVREFCQYKASLALLSPAERSAACLLILGLVQAPDVELAVMCGRVEEALPGGLAAAWAAGVARLQSEGVAGVMDLVQSIEKLLASDTGCYVNRSSVLGLILRRVYLSFDKLTFSEVSGLRQQMDRYYTLGRGALAGLLEEGEQSDMSLDCQQSGLEFRLPSLLPAAAPAAPPLEELGAVSRKQADLLIAQQASLLQTAECAALPPQELQAEVGRVLASCPALPEAHFLSYLNCLRVRDVAGAEHALYASGAQPADRVGPKSSQEDINKGFRYAALNLAAFHSRLGHTEEALAAIREATTMAQEASDHTCLQHVLSLLYRTVGPEQKQRLMERCIEKCSDLSLSYLASLGIQAFSQHAAATGAGPERVLELLARSDVLNCQHSIAELQAVGYTCKAAAWAQYGRPGLACTLSQLLLQINTADPARAGHNYSGEPTALALCSVALRLEATGHPGPADSVLRRAELLFPSERSQHSRVVSDGRQRVLLWRATAQLDWTRALRAVELLEAGGAPDARLMRAELCFKEGRAVEARQLVQEVLGAGPKHAELEVRALLLLADIHCWSGDPAGAVQQLVRGADLAGQQRLQLLHVQARLQLAHCQVRLWHRGRDRPDPPAADGLLRGRGGPGDRLPARPPGAWQPHRLEPRLAAGCQGAHLRLARRRPGRAQGRAAWRRRHDRSG
jgi:anaphase-promoting complex subunit 5